MNDFLAIEESASMEWVCERESVQDGISLRYIRYFSEDLNGFPLWMAAILAIPSGGASAPGLLHLHGGAQCAKEEIACAWARRGYITLCPDWSVPAGTSGAAHATRWPKDIPPVHATGVEAGEASIGPIVRGVRRGISFLHNLPEVDSDRIGMAGISWGGLMTWLVNGSDSRLRTAIAVYGSGLSAEREASPTWREAFQPMSVADSQRAPVLHLNGTHDFFGRLETSEALLQKAGTRNRHLYVPNEDHGLNETARHCAWAWLDLHLRGDGVPPPGPTRISGPNKRFYHAATNDRRNVWREISPEDLPGTGRTFVTETHANGLAFSSALQQGPPAPAPRVNHLWSADSDGMDALFLRWELENLQIHAPASARLVHTRHGVEAVPPQNRLCLFLRTDTVPPAQVTGLEVMCKAPRDSGIKLTLYTEPDIQDTNGFSSPVHLCGREGQQTLSFPFSSFRPLSGDSSKPDPERIHIVCLEFSTPNGIPANFSLFDIRFWG